MVGAYGVPGGGGVTFGDADQPTPLGISKDLSTGALAGGFVAFGALLLLMPFVIVPLLIKPFAPKWGYGKRVALGLLVSLSLAALRGVAKAGRKK
jgi:hypothetical protein